jgi:hypothetical protein
MQTSHGADHGARTGYQQKSNTKSIFMHIQKTAGTTIVNLAQQFYGWRNCTSHGNHFEHPDDHSFFDNQTLVKRYASLPFISGHFGYDFCKEFMVDRFSFTFLREPIERIISFYFFCRMRDGKEFPEYRLAQAHRLDQFLRLGMRDPYLRARIWNYQTWALAHGNFGRTRRELNSFAPGDLLDLALEHLAHFSFIGLTEKFRADRDVILSALGITRPSEDVFVNVTPGRPTLEDLSHSTRELLAELTELDRIVYRAARRKAACSDQCGIGDGQAIQQRAGSHLPRSPVFHHGG